MKEQDNYGLAINMKNFFANKKGIHLIHEESGDKYIQNGIAPTSFFGKKDHHTEPINKILDKVIKTAENKRTPYVGISNISQEGNTLSAKVYFSKSAFME